MAYITGYPTVLLALVFVLLCLAAWGGAAIGGRPDDAGVHEQFGIVRAATLTLLTLLIGFSFSLAMSRYDQRLNDEEQEANAIGTEHVRASLLPAADAAKVRALLVDYLDQRILFYTTREDEALRQINARTAKLQSELWSAVVGSATAQPTPVTALAVSGMNDVLNTQGYTQAAWTNRIPTSAWVLMVVLAIVSNLMVGYGARSIKDKAGLLLILPLVVSAAFFFIADIDSPRRGVIRVEPLNLTDLARSLRGP